MAFVPKYRKIANLLKQKIDSGIYSPSEPLPSELELCKIYSVSRSTITKALNDLRNMNIIYTVQGSGSYVDKRYISTTSNEFSNIISILLPYGDYNRSARTDETTILKSLEEQLSKNHFFPIVHFCNDDCDSFYQSLKKIQELPHIGVIAYPPRDATLLPKKFPDILDLLTSKPTVLIDQSISDIDTPCVHPDYFYDGALATNHLIECGYSKIFFCSAVLVNYNTSTNECFNGFKSVLKKHNHDYHSKYIYLQSSGECNRTQNIERQCEFLKQLVSQYPNERLGFVCYCDNMGMEMVEACHKIGLRVPEDIGIIGFGNLNIPLETGGYLSTVDYNLKKSSSVAAKTLINLIQNRKNTTPFHCEGTLLARDTTSTG